MTEFIVPFVTTANIQTVAAAEDVDPEGHIVHTSDPEIGEYVFAVQAKQDVLKVLEVYPAAQLEHATIPPGEL